MDEEELNTEEETNGLLAHLEECQENCLFSIVHCLDQGGDFVKADHMKILMDCEKICGLAKNFFLRNSTYAGDILDLCSGICEDCAQSCKTFFEDKMMQDCALVCENCAKACQEIIEEAEPEV